MAFERSCLLGNQKWSQGWSAWDKIRVVPSVEGNHLASVCHSYSQRHAPEATIALDNIPLNLQMSCIVLITAPRVSKMKSLPPPPPPALCNLPPPPGGGGEGSLHCFARQYLLQWFVFPICHTHVLALLSHYFKSVTCVYSVIFSLQRLCIWSRVPFSDPRCLLPVTVYGTTHAHLVYMCWPLLWGLHQMGCGFATFSTYALVGSLKWIVRVLNCQGSRLWLHHPSLQSHRTLPPSLCNPKGRHSASIPLAHCGGKCDTFVLWRH